MKELLETKGFKEYELTDDYIRYKKDSTDERWWFLYHFKSKESVLERYLLEQCQNKKNIYYFAEELYNGEYSKELEEIINNL